MTAKSICFNLPYPPSVNTIHTVARGRIILSQCARQYYKEVYEVLVESGLLPSKFTKERISVIVLTHQPDNRRRDIQNLGKVLLDSLTKKLVKDALQKSGIWDDDDQIDDFRIIRGENSKNNGYVEIKIKEINKTEVMKEWEEF